MPARSSARPRDLHIGAGRELREHERCNGGDAVPARSFSALPGATACTPGAGRELRVNERRDGGDACPPERRRRWARPHAVGSSASAQLQSFVGAVNGVGPRNSFTAKVHGAGGARGGQRRYSRSPPEGLINEVKAQSGKKITAQQVGHHQRGPTDPAVLGY